MTMWSESQRKQRELENEPKCYCERPVHFQDNNPHSYDERLSGICDYCKHRLAYHPVAGICTWAHHFEHTVKQEELSAQQNE